MTAGQWSFTRPGGCARTGAEPSRSSRSASRRCAGTHRWLSMRKRDVTLTVEDLERPEPGEPRELTAARHQVRQLRGELEDAHNRLAPAGPGLREQAQQVQRLREQVQGLRDQAQRLRDQVQRLRDQVQRLRRQAQRLREQRRLLRAMLGSRAFAVAEQLSRLQQRGKPVFSRKQIRRALGDDDPSA